MGVDFKEHVGFLTEALAVAAHNPLYQGMSLIG
jgi:hypothetical protein